MRKSDIPKIMAVIVTVIVIASFVMMVFGLLPHIHFWIVIVLSAIIAFKIIPRLRKAVEK